ncbi:hypothetical protein [Aeromicrobium massiliense]|uniref:hypothetical protein n=1 Tax=Aeromicrobium massiliense TaxID=1464554 RepID=UPI000675BE80|nr:hypothetical protein [Aeromicrobium massiliense]
MRRSRHAAIAALAVVVSTLVSPAPASADTGLGLECAAPTHGTGVMVVGDSVAHGSAGDWTWRYRLWRHLQDVGADVDLVGPRDDLLERFPGDDDQTYADPAFDRDHASYWGTARALLTPSLGTLVAACRPDVVVETLGVNDLAWLGIAPADLVRLAAHGVEEARAARPDVDVVLGQVPQSWLPGAAEYNDLLAGLEDELSTEASRVVVARAPETFAIDVDTYDFAHPSASGEVKIAASVADALAELGVGAPFPRPLPDVPNGPARVATLQAVPGDASAELSWERPDGSTAERVWVRDLTDGTDWAPVTEVAGTQAVLGGLVNGHVHEVRLQSRKGTAVAPRYSEPVQVVPTAPAPPPSPQPQEPEPDGPSAPPSDAPTPVAPSPTAPPATASPRPTPEARPVVPAVPRGVRLVAGDRRLDVGWDAVRGAGAYDVTWRESGRASTTRTARTTRVGTRLTGLVAGRRYDVAVRAVAGGRAGAAAVVSDRASGPTAGAPRRPRAVTRSSRSVRLSWSPGSRATRYEVWRTYRGATRLVARTTRTHVVVSTPRAGRATFRVRAWHQDLAGRWSSRVRAPRAR